MTPPRFPEDFVVESADGGATFLWWSPEGLPPRTPIGEPMPRGMMVAVDESVSHELDEYPDEDVVVSWSDDSICLEERIAVRPGPRRTERVALTVGYLWGMNFWDRPEEYSPPPPSSS